MQLFAKQNKFFIKLNINNVTTEEGRHEDRINKTFNKTMVWVWEWFKKQFLIGDTRCRWLVFSGKGMSGRNWWVWHWGFRWSCDSTPHKQLLRTGECDNVGCLYLWVLDNLDVEPGILLEELWLGCCDEGSNIFPQAHSFPSQSGILGGWRRGWYRSFI